MKAEDCIILVRSVGERTTNKCVEYVKRAFQTDDVQIISNLTPFQKMLDKCYEIGTEKSKTKKWTICVDADVFISPTKLEIFLSNVEALDLVGNFFCASPCFYDYFLGYSRPCGLHVYKTKLLEKARRFIISDTLRPETTVKRMMTDEGFKSYIVNITIGIHDFFDSYESIMVKGLLHMKKHSIGDELIAKWKVKAEEDENFKWMIRAAEVAENISEKKTKVDANWAKSIIKEHYPSFPQQKELTNLDIDRAMKEYVNIPVIQEE